MSTTRQPRALLFTTQRWPSAAMMARSLRDGGFLVGALCPSGHPLRKSASALVVRHYRHLTSAFDLDRAIDRWRPDILIACDDLAVDAAHRAWDCYTARGDVGSRAKAQLLESSFGSSASFATTRNKSRAISAAAALGIATPCSRLIDDPSSMAGTLQALGYPAVLKADALWGGLGVRIVHSADEAAAGYNDLTRAPGWGSVAKQVVRGAGLAPVLERRRFRPPLVSAQRFVPGRPVNAAAVCWNGELLACTTVEVLLNQRNNGPGSVVRVIEHPVVERAAARLTRELGLSGFCGFDFMLDRDDGNVLLLEINPRATSSSYLPSPTGVSLARRLHARLTGSVSPAGRPALSAGDVVVLFPQELERDPTSTYLNAPSHLVPWDEPALVAECVRLSFARSLPDRLVAQVRSVLGRVAAAGSPLRLGRRSTDPSG